ncbi:MAG TPA: DNA helicase RecG, partial [Candidatus Goldiibacteriota bacterium]|nr:DNA helicase RecG [Candidatus Goldiibacteriota bacterium]
GFKRLGIMTSTWDGFKISEEDLALRGPGEFMGTRQHGLPEFKMGNIVRDRKAMEESRQAADELISGKCDISHSEKEQLSRILKQNYGADFRLINIS